MEVTQAPLATEVASRYVIPDPFIAPSNKSLGQDLAGNNFYEFRNALGTRPRRIVQFPSTIHPGDVALTPAWLQWLRYTREEGPSLLEQESEKRRQVEMRQLAALADQRWAEKESVLDDPRKTGQTGPLMLPRDNAGYGMGQTESEDKEGVRNMAATAEEVQGKTEGKGSAVDKGRFKGETREKDPWSKTGPSEGWQPQAWTPGRRQ